MDTKFLLSAGGKMKIKYFIIGAFAGILTTTLVYSLVYAIWKSQLSNLSSYQISRSAFSAIVNTGLFSIPYYVYLLVGFIVGSGIGVRIGGMDSRRIVFWVFSFLLGGLSIYFMVKKFAFHSEGGYRTNGYYWFVPSTLIALWLGMYLGAFTGVIIALSVGWLSILGLGGFVTVQGMSSMLTTPGVAATFWGVVGAIAGHWIDKDSKTSKPRWEIGLAIAGLILGFVIRFFIFGLSVG